MRRTSIWFRLAVIFVGLFIVPGFMSTAVFAQEEITFRIAKFTCADDPGNVSLAAGNIPDDCDPTAGVAFEVTGEDGSVIGSCTTDATGLCSLSVPNEATVTVTEDETTGPMGFAPRENPITTQAVTEFAGALFINLPVVNGLPDTGAGGTGPVSDSLLVGALMATVLCGSLAVVIRRRYA
jgi:hypothetical protein